MEEEYGYLKIKTEEELEKVINNFNDINETVQAMMLLWDKNQEKTLEKGINFLINNEGDEYFQAMIVDIIYDIDFQMVLDCIEKRRDSIQPYLLGEVMGQMVVYSSYDYVKKYVSFIMKQYNLFNDIEKERISEKYAEFVQEFKVNNLEQNISE